MSDYPKAHNLIASMIEAQEAAGQEWFLNSATLPKKMSKRCTRDMLEQMGIRFGSDVDDLFVEANLPEGWMKKGIHNTLWTELHDAKGRVRAYIFYAATHYDRRAHIRLTTRYDIDDCDPCDSDGNPVEYGNHTHCKTAVKDGDVIIHTVGVRKYQDWENGYEHYDQAFAWMEANYPDWRNPLAYWE